MPTVQQIWYSNVSGSKMVGIQIPNEHRFWVSIIQIPAVSLVDSQVKYLGIQIHFPNRTPRQEDHDRSEDVRSQAGVE